jgi:muramoyltetrapeptide carboxypeptidase
VFGGSVAERLDCFHQLLLQPDLKAVFFVRGGHGVLPLLESIDWDLVTKEPRAYVGYSDLTPFLLETTRRSGLMTFHGPMVAVEFARGLEDIERRSLLAALDGSPLSSYELTGVAGGPAVEGVLLGGCLSLLASTVGTEFALKPEQPTVLFWEDVGEPYYRLDRMLTQLRLSGSVSAVSGMVIGRTGLEATELERLGRDFGRSFGSGLSSGHCKPNLTLPLGAEVRLDPSSRRIEFELG